MRHLIASLLFGLGACASVNAAERAIDKEVFIDASVDQVWEAWTTKTGITSFFAPDAEIDPRVGGAFHVFINPYADPGLKGADTMQYLALQPKTMLSFDWNAPPSLPNVRNQHTVVILRFAPDGSKTRLTLHHLGSGSADGADGKEWDDAYRYFDRAWGAVLANLQKRFAPGGQPMDWTEWLSG
ncbi:MAG: SRPBCC family protein [Burkholderiaceae bacterium]